MFPIQPHPLPEDALLQRYLRSGAYTDCYATTVRAPVSFADYVVAFYTTPVFRVERIILQLAIARPSSDAQARQVAEGGGDAFAAWTVEDRSANQLLMRDIYGRTRSWFMASPEAGGATRLYFGSAVVPKRGAAASDRPRLGRDFGLMLGFHRLYSRVLLHSARRSLERRAS